MEVLSKKGKATKFNPPAKSNFKSVSPYRQPYPSGVLISRVQGCPSL